ncbi:MAG TPA: Mu transposase C-terminal domain-containing protein [Spirochaetales bacterium]|nr:Mu transposase C-terminal domain-containing protein [Spirochaetales bacterium]
MNELSTTAIATALGTSRQAVMQRAEAERWLCRGEGRSLRWLPQGLPQDVLARLIGNGYLEPEKPHGHEDAEQSRMARERAFLEARDIDREKAQLRAALIGLYQGSGSRVQDFVVAYNAGRVNPALSGALGPISQATFYRWLQGWEEAGRSLAGLVPRYAERRAVQGSGASLSDLVKGYAEWLYLKPQRPTAGHVYRALAALRDEGRIPELPSYATVLRYLQGLPPTYVAFWREGRSRWSADFNPYIERSMELYRPMDLVTSDHVMIDAVVEYQGRLIRPWLTTVQDFRSGLVLGMCPCPTPSYLSITVSLFLMASRYGKAKILTVDNGKDYRGQFLNGKTMNFQSFTEDGFPEEEEVYAAGAYAACVDEVSFTWVYAGQSKGKHERIHGIWQEYLAKELATYVGSNTRDCPEETKLLWRGAAALERRGKVPTWDEFVRILAAGLDWWNSSWRGTGKGMEGRTPQEVFDELAPEPRTVSRELLELALCRSDKRRVRENGVRVDGVNYWAPELQRYVGRDVLVKRPLAAPETAIICDAKGALLCRAEANYFAETEDTTATIERRKKAAKTNLELVGELSKGRIAPPEGMRSIGEMYRARLPKDDAPLPLAAGAEGDAVSGAATADAEWNARAKDHDFIDFLGQE